ncbi:MAG TPA: hypothetical protein VMI12_18870, partial [Puia sp.]|nr:hypothetical protein [Puia sp.]
MKSNKVKTLFVVILAFTIGLLFHYSSNPLIALIWLGVYGIAVIFSVAVISIGLFSKKIKLWYFIGLIP